MDKKMYTATTVKECFIFVSGMRYSWYLTSNNGHIELVYWRSIFLVLINKYNYFFIVLYCSPNDPKMATIFLFNYNELINNCPIFYTTEVSANSRLVSTTVTSRYQYLIRMTPRYQITDSFLLPIQGNVSSTMAG
jgi:hypothetical protein